MRLSINSQSIDIQAFRFKTQCIGDDAIIMFTASVIQRVETLYLADDQEQALLQARHDLHFTMPTLVCHAAVHGTSVKDLQLSSDPPANVNNAFQADF